MRKSLFKMGVVTLLMLLVAGAALADAEPKRLQVSGTAVVTGDPRHRLHHRWVWKPKTPPAEKAAQDNASIMAQVLAALRGNGLTEKEVSTRRLQHLGFHPDGQPRDRQGRNGHHLLGAEPHQHHYQEFGQRRGDRGPGQ